jgi:hypothetical protein
MHPNPHILQSSLDRECIDAWCTVQEIYNPIYNLKLHPEKSRFANRSTYTETPPFDSGTSRRTNPCRPLHLPGAHATPTTYI